MTKSELIALVCEKSGVSPLDARRIVELTFDTIAAELKKGEKVQLTGFGTFEIKDREARVGRDPRTKEPIEIPAAKVPAFHPSKTLKKKIGE